MNLNEREQALMNIEEEINIVCSIKDYISEEEIKNFIESFPLLNERDIRELLVKVTGNSIYIDDWKGRSEITKKIYTLKIKLFP